MWLFHFVLYVVATLLAVLNAISGFGGNISSVSAGLGWLVIAMFFVSSALDKYRRVKSE